MSQNPYAPPGAELATPRTAAQTPPRLDFEIGQCFSDGWSNTWANFPLWLGVAFVWLAASALAAGTLIGWPALPVLAWGSTYFVLRMHDGEAEFGDLFAGFSRLRSSLVDMSLAGIGFLFLSMLGSTPQFFAAWSDSAALVGLSYLFSLAFGFFVTSRLTLTFFYVVDQQLPALEAFQTCWAETARCRLKIVLLGLAGTPIVLAGLLAFVIGVLPAMAILFLTYASAYRQIAGRPAPPRSAAA